MGKRFLEGQLHTSVHLGHKQRHALAAILEDDMSEPASLIDARVPLKHVGQACCRMTSFGAGSENAIAAP